MSEFEIEAHLGQHIQKSTSIVEVPFLSRGFQMSLTEEVFQLERENIHRKGFITNPKIILKAYRTVISHNSNPVRDHRKFEGSDQPRTTIGGSKFSHNSSPSIIFLAVKLPLILFVKAKFP